MNKHIELNPVAFERGTSNAYRVAIIGSGPRGLSVLERLAVHLIQAAPARAVHLYLVDNYQIGCGRIWRTDQPRWFLMNTVADEVSAFSGTCDEGPARPGAGPSLAQWWAARDPAYPGPNSYAPRGLYGEYMLDVLAAIRRALPPGCVLHEVTKAVADLEPGDDGVHLAFADGTMLNVNRVVLATGHTEIEVDAAQQPLQAFAASTPQVAYVRGDSAADMPLDAIPDGSHVGVIGLGLAFFDVIASLTTGRGGTFEIVGTRYVYRSSGREPHVVAGSRSGMPIRARGRNQKDPNHRISPMVFTMERAEALAVRGRVSFTAEVLPLLLAEMDIAFYDAILRRSLSDAAASAFRQHLAGQPLVTRELIRETAKHLGVEHSLPVDLDVIAHPFDHQHYSTPAAFRAALLKEVAQDLADAEAGNVDSPMKAALDIIRDSRSLIRTIVDFGGLTPESYQRDFLGWYVPRSAFLSAGPPRSRLKELTALIEAGVLEIIGPAFTVTPDDSSRRFLCHSPVVADSTVAVETVVDARIPVPNLHRDRSPLTARLRERGVWSSFINRGTDSYFDTGGVNVTRAPFHPVARDGKVHRNLYVIGIPSEHTRWFMQAGSSRPGFWTDFICDAESIAADIALGIPPEATAAPLGAETVAA